MASINQEVEYRIINRSPRIKGKLEEEIALILQPFLTKKKHTKSTAFKKHSFSNPLFGHNPSEGLKAAFRKHKN
jgi:hypothetical protein